MTDPRADKIADELADAIACSHKDQVELTARLAGIVKSDAKAQERITKSKDENLLSDLLGEVYTTPF